MKLTDEVLNKAKEIAIDMINGELKKCRFCGTMLPNTAEFFYKKPKTKDGLDSICKSCNLEFRKKSEKRKLRKLALEESSITLEERLKTPARQYVEGDLTLMNYKEPLTAVKDGFGFYGVLTATNDGKYVQCHICGKLFANLSAHVFGFHKLKDKEYKGTYGLAYTTALLSEEQREASKARTVAFLKTLSEEEKVAYIQRARERSLEKKNLEKRRAAGQPKLQLESMNKRGTCPDQLLQKIMEVKETVGHTPSKKEFIAYTNTQRYVHLIYKVYGSWNNAIKILGLDIHDPHAKRGTKEYKVYSDEELLEYLRVFTMEHGDIPTQTDFYRGLLPSLDTYVEHFGSIDAARKEAGVYEILEQDVAKK